MSKTKTRPHTGKDLTYIKRRLYAYRQKFGLPPNSPLWDDNPHNYVIENIRKVYPLIGKGRTSHFVYYAKSDRIIKHSTSDLRNFKNPMVPNSVVPPHIYIPAYSNRIWWEDIVPGINFKIIGPVGSRSAYLTLFLYPDPSRNRIKTGCFYGTLREFKYNLSPRRYLKDRIGPNTPKEEAAQYKFALKSYQALLPFITLMMTSRNHRNPTSSAL